MGPLTSFACPTAQPLGLLMNKPFNIAVISALVLSTIFWALPFLDHYYLSDEAIELLGANGWGSIIPNSSLIYWGLYVFWVLVSAGLILRLSIARSAYAGGIIIIGIANFAWGFRVHTPLEAGIGNIIAMLDGAILVMCFFTSVCHEFTNPNKSLNQTGAQNAPPG